MLQNGIDGIILLIFIIKTVKKEESERERERERKKARKKKRVNKKKTTAKHGGIRARDRSESGILLSFGCYRKEH